MPPTIFFWELISGEIISPVTHAHAAGSHSQYIVLHATLNLLVTTMVINPFHRLSLHCMPWSIKIVLQPQIFQHLSLSLFLGHGGGVPPQLHHLLKLVCQSMTLFFAKPLFLNCHFPGNDNQTFHIYFIYIYMQKSTLSVSCVVYISSFEIIR